MRKLINQQYTSKVAIKDGNGEEAEDVQLGQKLLTEQHGSKVATKDGSRQESEDGIGVADQLRSRVAEYFNGDKAEENAGAIAGDQHGSTADKNRRILKTYLIGNVSNMPQS